MEFSKMDPRNKNKKIEASSVAEYLQKYQEGLTQALSTVSAKALDQVYQILLEARKNNKNIFVGGNGGSAAIADHLCCDFTKGTYVDHKPTLKTQSLVANSALLTALANDYGYEKSLSAQIEMLGSSGDVLLVISSSGNSANIVDAIKVAKEKGMKTISLSGFSGGKAHELAQAGVHVNFDNYGIVEDAHQMIMHTLAQFIASQDIKNK